jgi:hypothetical protein
VALDTTIKNLAKFAKSNVDLATGKSIVSWFC